MLPDYLWGIETFPLFWQVLSSCFQTTYEELKHTTSLEKYIKVYYASRLPMRNWNSAVAPLPMTVSASRLPMRNWNQLMAGKARNRDRFQTTYEELKPNNHSFSWHHALASRLPMRNWNINRALISPLYPASSFQTTYEELKLDIKQAGMVNLLLPDYLWGIETS